MYEILHTYNGTPDGHCGPFPTALSAFKQAARLAIGYRGGARYQANIIDRSRQKTVATVGRNGKRAVTATLAVPDSLGISAPHRLRQWTIR